MERLSKKGMSEEYLVSMLQESIIAEQTAGDFYRYIAQKIKNGKIREKFMDFGDKEAEEHKGLLNDRLKLITGQYYNPDLSKLDVNINVSSFSLVGALEMGKESERRAIEFYKEAIKKDREYKKIYGQIIKEEKEHWAVIDKEKRFQPKGGPFYSAGKFTRLLSLLMQIYT